MVYIELRRRGGEIFYHNSGNTECDFVVRDGFRVVQAIQVCYLLGSSDTRERKSAAFGMLWIHTIFWKEQ